MMRKGILGIASTKNSHKGKKFSAIAMSLLIF